MLFSASSLLLHSLSPSIGFSSCYSASWSSYSTLCSISYLVECCPVSSSDPCTSCLLSSWGNACSISVPYFEGWYSLAGPQPISAVLLVAFGRIVAVFVFLEISYFVSSPLCKGASSFNSSNTFYSNSTNRGSPSLAFSSSSAVELVNLNLGSWALDRDGGLPLWLTMCCSCSWRVFYEGLIWVAADIIGAGFYIWVWIWMAWFGIRLLLISWPIDCI